MTDQPSDRPSPRSAVRVVLVDDHRMFRSGVRAELAAVDDGVEVVGEAEDAQQAVAVITATAARRRAARRAPARRRRPGRAAGAGRPSCPT